MRRDGKPPREYSLDGSPAAIGRNADNEIVLDDAGVSRYHARIEWRGAACVLEDLGSTNGTWINDERLESPTPIEDGDVVRFGSISFTFTIGGVRTLTLGAESTPPLPNGLTAREAEVLALLAQGSSNREIAEALVLSIRTVERHVCNIYTKIDAHGRAAATAYALANRLSHYRP